MPKPPISAMPPMISSGMSVLARWMCSARGRICSSANRWKVSRTSSKSESRWRGPGSSASGARKAGVAVVGQDGLEGWRPTRGRHPTNGCARPSGRQIGDRVGDEGTGQPGLGRTVRTVGECRLCSADGGSGVGDVVGQHLLDVGTAAVARAAMPDSTTDRAVDRASAARLRSGVDGAAAGCQALGRRPVGSPIKRTGRPPALPTAKAALPRAPHSSGACATTVTRGGSTTGSSPGSTSVSRVR